MSLTPLSCLAVDFETGEAKFTLPPELNSLEALQKVDLITSIMGEMFIELRESMTAYFVTVATNNYKPEYKFEQYYKLFQKTLDHMGMDELEGLKEMCKEATISWLQTKAQTVTPEGNTIN